MPLCLRLDLIYYPKYSPTPSLDSRYYLLSFPYYHTLPLRSCCYIPLCKTTLLYLPRLPPFHCSPYLLPAHGPRLHLSWESHARGYGHGHGHARRQGGYVKRCHHNIDDNHLAEPIIFRCPLPTYCDHTTALHS